MAYDWMNFRLCRSRLNANKGNSTEVMDPCHIQNGWFTIDFSTFLLKPSTSVPEYIHTWVITSITILDLNNNDYVDERIAVIREYCLGHLTIDQVQSKWPFIAAEIDRQDFDRNYAPGMLAYFTRAP